MKIISITFFILITIFSGCKKDNIVKGYYDSMHYVRTGSDDIDFNVYPTNNADSVKVVVNKYNYRDTVINTIIVSTSNDPTLIGYHKAINSQVQINGNYRGSSLLTGVFINIYVVAKGKETEVTNTDLRNTLLNLDRK